MTNAPRVLRIVRTLVWSMPYPVVVWECTARPRGGKRPRVFVNPTRRVSPFQPEAQLGMGCLKPGSSAGPRTGFAPRALRALEIRLSEP
jgi:hypothetical protein